MHRHHQQEVATEAQATAMVQRAEEEAKSECRSVMGRTGVQDLPWRESALTCFRCDGAKPLQISTWPYGQSARRGRPSPNGSPHWRRYGNTAKCPGTTRCVFRRTHGLAPHRLGTGSNVRRENADAHCAGGNGQGPSTGQTTPEKPCSIMAGQGIGGQKSYRKPREADEWRRPRTLAFREGQMERGVSNG